MISQRTRTIWHAHITASLRQFVHTYISYYINFKLHIHLQSSVMKLMLFTGLISWPCWIFSLIFRVDLIRMSWDNRKFTHTKSHVVFVPSYVHKPKWKCQEYKLYHFISKYNRCCQIRFKLRLLKLLLIKYPNIIQNLFFDIVNIFVIRTKLIPL